MIMRYASFSDKEKFTLKKMFLIPCFCDDGKFVLPGISKKNSSRNYLPDLWLKLIIFFLL